LKKQQRKWGLIMMIDLSALEETTSDGKAIRVKLNDIELDPDQPRTEKRPEEISELAENIKKRGVKQPISVKPHPIESKKWTTHQQ
jgi:ParB family chromosome partitioning protein